MAVDKIWEDETRRTVEILGGAEQKYKRSVEDKLTLRFTYDEWKKLFNVAEGYEPCGTGWEPYMKTQPIVIYFIRRENDERT